MATDLVAGLVGLAAGMIMLVAVYIVSNATKNDGNYTEAERKLILGEIAKLRTINMHPDSINAADYPKAVGKISSTNLDLTQSCFCSNLCPEYARVALVYSGIKDASECAKVRGTSLIDIAWRGYLGCPPFRCSYEFLEMSQTGQFQGQSC